MDIEWRTIQLFLGEDGVAEVSVDATNPKKLTCTCKQFPSLAKCKHVRWVRDRMAGTGVYNVSIPDHISDKEAETALSDSDLFRDLVIKYGTVEVID